MTIKIEIQRDEYYGDSYRASLPMIRRSAGIREFHYGEGDTRELAIADLKAQVAAHAPDLLAKLAKANIDDLADAPGRVM